MAGEHSEHISPDIQEEELHRAATAAYHGDCAMCATARGIRTSLWYGDTAQEVHALIEAHIQTEHPDLIRVWKNVRRQAYKDDT